MDGRRLLLVTIMLGAAALQGCTFARMAYTTERARLADLRAWEERLAQMDCAGLTLEYERLEARRDGMVDFDQRQDTMRGEMTEKSCVLPEALS